MPVMQLSRHQSGAAFFVIFQILVAKHRWASNGCNHLCTHLALVWQKNCSWNEILSIKKQRHRQWSDRWLLSPSPLTAGFVYSLHMGKVSALQKSTKWLAACWWSVWCRSWWVVCGFTERHRTVHLQEERVWGLAVQTKWNPLRDPQHPRSNTQCQRTEDPTGHTQGEVLFFTAQSDLWGSFISEENHCLHFVRLWDFVCSGVRSYQNIMTVNFWLVWVS